MIDRTVLQTGAEIPFPQGKLIIHPPNLYEIGLIGGEAALWGACDVLTANKNSLVDMDKSVLDNISNFDIIMSIMLDKDSKVKAQTINVMKLFSLLFPSYVCSLQKQKIIFTKGDQEGYLDATNIDLFQQIIRQLFVLNKTKGEDYNPVNKKAAALAAKMQKARQKVAAQKAATATQQSIIDRYISILAVGERKNQTDICKLTVYQLFDEFERFQLNASYEANIRARLAGATELDDPADWMKDLQTKEDSNTKNVFD